MRVLNPDFTDFIEALNKAEVEYLLVGGYAVIYYGYNRTTGDLDIWVNPTIENYQRLTIAFDRFGMGMFGMEEKVFVESQQYNVFTFGRPPVCIEILTAVSGLEFKEAHKNARTVEYDEGLYVPLIDLPDLVRNKRSSNRPKDLDDIEKLEN